MNLLSDRSGPAFAARLTIIAVFALATAFAGVFSMPPLDRDESRFAQATAQMLESGDFVSIRFQDDERNKKPVGIHWLQAASVEAFSSVEAREIWAYRLPSVAGALLAALFTYFAGARLFGPSTGFLAALILASAPAVAGEATIAKTDAMLLACVTGAQAAFIYVFASVVEGRKPKAILPFAFWIAIGAGILIKGPIILLIVGATAIAMFVHRPRADWVLALRPAMGAIILVLMITPWAIAINEKTDGRFFAEAIGGDMLAKIGGAKESHGGPPGYYAALAFILLWPAAALILPGLRAAFIGKSIWSNWFLLSWSAPSWVIFELTATKLPHYALPLYPAVALMAANAASTGAIAGWPLLNRFSAGLHILIGLALASLVAALPVIYLEEHLRPYCFAAAAALGAASIAVGVLFLRRSAIEGTIAAAFVSSALAWTLLHGVLPNLDRLTLSPQLSASLDAADLHPLRDGAAPAVLSGYYEPSAIFLLGTRTKLADGRNAAEHFADSGGAAIIEAREESAFLDRLHTHGPAAEKIDEIQGINYSNGKDVILLIYRRQTDAASSTGSM